MDKESESEICYNEGENKNRVLRGKIVERNEKEIIVQRDDGTYTIPMGRVVYIKDPAKKTEGGE